MRRFIPLFCLILLITAPAMACTFGKPTALVFSPDSLPAAQVGQPYSATIQLSNQRTPAFAMSASDDLPVGLAAEFNQDTQSLTISGTPTQDGTFKFTISALCYGTNTSGQTGEKEYELTVTP